MFFENLKKQWPLILTSSIILVNLEQAGEIIGWSSPILSYLNSSDSLIPITSDEGSWIVSIVPLTSLVVTPLSALCIHYYGRRITTLLSAIPCAISWIIIAFSTSYAHLMIARGIQGISQSLTYTVSPIYLAEMSPDNVRGSIGLCMALVGNIGIIWVYWVGSFPKLWLSSLLSAVPLLIIVVFGNWLPESPYYLIANNRREDAEKVLKKLRKTQHVEAEIQKIESNISTTKTGSSILELFKEENHRRAFFIVIGSITFAQFTGVVTLQFYAHVIFNRVANVSSNTLSMSKAVLDLFSSLISAIFIDKYGKRPLLLISCVGSIIFQGVLGVYFYLLEAKVNVDVIWWLPLASMALFDFCNVIGIYSIYLVIMGEFFHPKVKSVAICISKMYMALAIVLTSKLFQIITDAFGSYVPFFGFSFMGFLGTLFVYFCIPETKGKSLEDIQYYLVHKKYRCNEK